MATVFARMAAFRARYPRKLVGAAVILVITVLLAVYNQRMAMGHWSYRSEFDITVKGQSDCYLPEMCYYTLKERNMWKRVQCNADWYWYKRCQGNRDGLESPKGLNQTEGKLSSPSKDSSKSPKFMNKTWSAVSEVPWSYPLGFVSELFESFAHGINSLLADIGEKSSDAVSYFETLASATATVFFATGQKSLDWIKHIQSLVTKDFGLLVSFLLERLFYGAEVIIGWPRRLSDHIRKSITSQAILEQLSEGIAYPDSPKLVSGVFFKAGYAWGKYTSLSTYLLPAKSVLRQVREISEAMLKSVSEGLYYIVLHERMPKSWFKYGDSWRTSFDHILQKGQRSIYQILEMFTLETARSSVTGLAERETWEVLLPVLEWLFQGIGEMFS
ncbi:hypothetical protein EG329_013799 [Mollisiaceae sp. DMI_Dod_QoI]|nr:hypothetical protein EG329_013799 [Helotiales sp. DMI_Dod_QoI]